MNRQYAVLGVFICLGIALSAITVRVSSSSPIDLIGASHIVVYTFSVGLLSFFIHHYLLKSKSYFLFLKNQYLISILIISLVATFIFPIEFIFDYIFMVLVQEDPLRVHFFDKSWGLLVFRTLLISSIYFFIVYCMQLLQESQQRNLEIEKLKQAQLEADLSNLKEQMSPHFLFNTLNTLSSIASEKPVKGYVAELANVYRYMLIHNKMNVVTLEQELNFIKSYLYIIKIRMGGNIIISIAIDDSLMTTKMPPLTLQLLLENATKHNVASINYPLKIELYNDNNTITVSNSYNPKNSTQYSTGVGLNNLMNRYELLFSENISIEKDEKLFIVKLPIIKK